jgi:hypothetical protein
VIDHYTKLGYQGVANLFALARTEVVNTYIHLTLHDLAKRLVPAPVYETVIINNKGLLSKVNKQAPTLAVEFATAAFRLHSMVRQSYTIRNHKVVKLKDIFRFTGRHAEANQGEEFFPLAESMVIDWRTFFDIDSNVGHQTANRISPLVPVFKKRTDPLPGHDFDKTAKDQNNEISMYFRSIMRGMSLKLPTGQEAVDFLLSSRGEPAAAKKMSLQRMEFDWPGNINALPGLKKNTPLWLYLMLESRGYGPCRVENSTLGTLGGWLVADSLVTAARSVDLPGIQDWHPADSVIFQDKGGGTGKKKSPRHISIGDLVRYTYPDDFNS